MLSVGHDADTCPARIQCGTRPWSALHASSMGHGRGQPGRQPRGEAGTTTASTFSGNISSLADILRNQPATRVTASRASCSKPCRTGSACSPSPSHSPAARLGLQGRTVGAHSACGPASLSKTCARCGRCCEQGGLGDSACGRRPGGGSREPGGKCSRVCLSRKRSDSHH